MKVPIVVGVVATLVLGAAGFYTYRWREWSREQLQMSRMVQGLEGLLLGLQYKYEETPEEEQAMKVSIAQQISEVVIEIAELKESMRLHENRGWFP